MPKVAIVGAGFAGLAAANRLIESGIRPIIIEARQEPIATTTGGIADWWFNAIKMSYPDEVVAAKIRGVRLVSPDGNEAVVKSDKSVGAVLYPEAYLKYYIRKLKDEGAEFITPGYFVQIRGRELTYIKSGIEKVMTGVDYLIAADGAMSSVRSSLGYPPPDFEDIHLGYEETVDNVGGFSPDIVHIYIDSWIARKGYIWIFPDDPFGTRVRVGLGIPKSNGESPKDLYESRLLVKYPELKMEPYKCVGGHIPTAPLPETNVHGNVLFVGDAGRFCSPLHGGGIGFGAMSGVFAAEAVIAKNPSLYDIKWKQEIAPILKRHYMLKKMLYRWDDKAFNKAVDAVKTFEVKLEGLTNPNEVIMSFMKHLALTHPELIPQFLRIGFYA